MNKPTIILIALLSADTAIAADSYTIDPNHTLPMFEINHLGFSTQRGRFDRTSGHFAIDAEKKTGVVEWTIDAASINMGQTKWNDHMKSADFFNVEQFPTITFRSDTLIFKDKLPVAAEGTLTLLGVSKPLTVTIHRYTCGVNPISKKDTCAADIEATLKRSDFGMTKYLPAVGDEVRALVPVEAIKE